MTRNVIGRKGSSEKREIERWKDRQIEVDTEIRNETEVERERQRERHTHTPNDDK
jgi:hypothetical protein